MSTTDERARVAGVELGGTKCVCVLADGEGTILKQARVDTTTPDETLSGVEAILDGWRADDGFRALGIASFGPLDLDPASPNWGSIPATTKPHWSGADVAKRLTGRYGVPYAFDTDVNGAAFAEGRWGAAQGLNDFAYITVGTGVGVGLIVNGKATRGFGHCELGHMRVQRIEGDVWPGWCVFHGGCVEGLASGSAIRARLGRDDIGDLAVDDPVWGNVAHTLAQLAHTLCLTAAPRRILIGGGVVTGQPHLLPLIETKLRESLNGYLVLPEETIVMAPGLGDRAGPLGPVAMALDQL